LPGAKEALTTLQKRQIPFILLTNGGGKHESERVAELSRRLDVSLDTSMFVQSHTPFASLVHGSKDKPGLKDEPILVVGGNGDSCRRVAEA
jgi:ribonucleotide monophosphatase NagD (HAD superfamily)